MQFDDLHTTEIENRIAAAWRTLHTLKARLRATTTLSTAGSNFSTERSLRQFFLGAKRGPQQTNENNGCGRLSGRCSR
eukprot:2504710-Pyramimonas_sp.AAC.1